MPLPLAPVLALALAAADFPKDVVTPTPTDAIGLGALYAVRDGKLWVKKPASSGTWALHGGTGLPPGTTHAVVAVFADEDDMFTVLTDDGLLHHHEGEAPGWDSLWGLPSLPSSARGPLSLHIASAPLPQGRVVYSMRHKNVLFYEDRNGAEFHWGDAGCTSLFVLDDDRRRILFGDPWLPPDFSREVCAPERGGLEMAAIAASASMLFVIGTDGALYTRFDDYDHNGGTPLFSYDYRPARSAKPPSAGGLPGTDLLSAAQTRGLPGDDWHAQPAIPLEGSARISSHIAILQNGHGNRARLLRVVGDDRDGRRGVYEKMLDDAAWKFRAIPDVARVAGAAVGDDEWIDTSAAQKARAHHPGPRARYGGFLREDGDQDLPRVYASTDDFAFHCSPFHLALEVDGVPVKLVAHAVDAWTIFTETDPVDDDIATKLYKITLFLDPAAPENAALGAVTRQKLDTIFRGSLEETFAFTAMANQHEIVMQPVSYPLDLARKRWSLVLRKDPSTRALAFVPLRPATKTAAAVVDVAAARSGARCGADAALRAKSATALGQVRALREDWERRLALSSVLEAAVPSSTGVVDVGTVVSTLRFTWPLTGWLNSLELHLPAVLGAPALGYARLLDSSRADFDEVERVLSRCAEARPQ